jgi:Protein of unknown function (DUF3768)
MSTVARNAAQIAQLNDRFRRTLSGGGRRLMTAGIAALPIADQVAIVDQVMAFDAFTPDNDPYGEHDFGSFEHAGHRIFWKIDTYADDSLTYGAEDAADPAAVRVLTIMLAEEY